MSKFTHSTMQSYTKHVQDFSFSVLDVGVGEKSNKFDVSLFVVLNINPLIWLQVSPTLTLTTIFGHFILHCTVTDESEACLKRTFIIKAENISLNHQSTDACGSNIKQSKQGVPSK